ncbi:MAG: pitrilysin family protein [Gemmatimonadales bacterium]|jgi:predicted Zn-dependent peptidase
MTTMAQTARMALALLMSAAPLTAQVPDRSGPPALGTPPTLSLPPIQEFTLSNGLPVMLMEKHNVPVVQVNVLVHAGSANDPRDKIGLATMMADMMDEGAGARDALELADAIEFLGARIGIGAGTHTISASLYAPVTKLDDALPLMADILLRPTFPEDELERKRLSRLTQILQAHDEPRAIASILFSKALFGDDHPYGNPGIGDEASTRSITVEDLRTFHETYVKANNAVVIAVGDIAPDEFLPKLERALGSWATGSVPTPSWPEADQVDRTHVLLVDKPGAPQSEIRIGRIGAARTTEDYYALDVMNTILGGSFTSRLMQNLREDKGYTYGAGSGFSFRIMPGPFVASSAVQTDATAASLREFFKEFDAIREPVPDEELARGKNYQALAFPGAFQSVGGIAGNLSDIAIYDLPRDYFNQYIERILAVSQRDVQVVADKYIVPDQMLVVVVGDLATIEESVRALDLGPVQILSVEDVLGPKPELGGMQ